jgi:hypothetical protein
MKSTRCVGPSSVGIMRTILYEIEIMIDNIDYGTFEHRLALLWFRDRLRKRLG